MKFKRYDDAVITEGSGRTFRAPVFIAGDVGPVLRAAEEWFRVSAQVDPGTVTRVTDAALSRLIDALRKAGA